MMNDAVYDAVWDAVYDTWNNIGAVLKYTSTIQRK